MKLNDWLQQNGVTQQQFAAVAGISQSTISRLIHSPEKRNPSWKLLDAISKATGGAVTANDFFDLTQAAE